MFHAIRGKKDFTDEETKAINEKFNIDLKNIKDINDEGIKKSTNFTVEYINRRTKNSIPEALKEKIKNSTKSTDGVVFESRFTLFGESKNIYFCTEKHTTQEYSYCPELKNISFEETNIVSK
jgi:hypothetical protein